MILKYVNVSVSLHAANDLPSTNLSCLKIGK